MIISNPVSAIVVDHHNPAINPKTNNKRRLESINNTDLNFNAEYFLTKKRKLPIRNCDPVFESQFKIKTVTIYTNKMEISTNTRKKIKQCWKKVKKTDRIPMSDNDYKRCITKSSLDGNDPWTVKYEVKEIDDFFGYGLFAKQAYKKNEIIGFYAGYIVPRKFTLDTTYIFSLTYPYEDFQIDPTKYGNATRFINHTTEKLSNTSPEIGFFDELPYVFFIAKCAIKAGEEIMFNYGEDYWEAKDITPIIRAPSGEYPIIYPMDKEILWAYRAGKGTE